MMVVERLEGRSGWALNPVARAFAISLACHLALFSTLEIGHRLELWRFGPFALLARALRLNLDPTLAAAKPARRTPAPPKPETPDVPLLFVDVDPSQATPDAPERTPYYSAVNSRAANPDTAKDTPTPKLDGNQDRVLKTMDTTKAKVAAIPLQPAPITPAASEQKDEQARPEPVPTPQPAPTPPPGDLAMAKPTAAPAVTPETPTPAPATHARPRTIAAARAQQLNDQSALVGGRMRQEGGVRRFSVQASVDTRATPLGLYDARFIEAVQQCWFSLLQAQRYSLDRMGKVVLDFRMTADGRITDMRIGESNVGDIYTTLCELAITKPAPFEKWPPDMRRMVGANTREVRFTFYY